MTRDATGLGAFDEPPWSDCWGTCGIRGAFAAAVARSGSSTNARLSFFGAVWPNRLFEGGAIGEVGREAKVEIAVDK